LPSADKALKQKERSVDRGVRGRSFDRGPKLLAADWSSLP